MTESDKAWLAGLIDGEGWVGIRHSKMGGTSAVLTVGMTHEATIRHIESIAGGKVTFRKASSKAWKDLWVWALYGDPACALAGRLVKYSRTKRAQLTLLSMMPASPRNNQYHQNDGVKELRAHFAHVMKWLNRKGPDGD